MKLKDFLLIFFSSLLICVVMFLFSGIILVYDSNFYREEAEKHGVYDKFVNYTLVDSSYDNLINYFSGREELSNIYNTKERSHLVDVKSVIDFIRNLFLILFFSLILVLALLLYRRYEYIWIILVGGFVFVILFSIIFSLFNFDSLFDSFHKTFFSAGSWIFDENSFLISLFPGGLFIDALVRILLSSVFFGMFSASLGILFRKFN